MGYIARIGLIDWQYEQNWCLLNLPPLKVNGIPKHEKHDTPGGDDWGGRSTGNGR